MRWEDYRLLRDLHAEGLITDEERDATWERWVNEYAYSLWPTHPMWEVKCHT